MDHPPGRGRIHRKHRRLQGIKPLRQSYQRLGRHDHLLGPSSESQRHHSLPGNEPANRGSNALDHSRTLVSNRARKRRQLAIGALDHIQIRWIDRRGDHPHQHLIRSRLRKANFLHAQSGRLGPKGGENAGACHCRLLALIPSVRFAKIDPVLHSLWCHRISVVPAFKQYSNPISPSETE